MAITFVDRYALSCSIIAKKKGATKKAPAKKASSPKKTKEAQAIEAVESEPPVSIAAKVDLATIILTKKTAPNKLIVDDSATDDHSTIAVDPSKMEELGLFSGDSVLLRGKKRKTTVAIISSEESVPISRVQMTKVVRSNLR